VTWFKPGHDRGGRTKGVPNYLTQEAREAINMAFQGAGGVEKLTEWAKKNYTTFVTMVGIKLLPHHVQVNEQTNKAFRTIEEVEAAIRERPIPMARLEPILLELGGKDTNALREDIRRASTDSSQ
jgi:hypothetical protein